MYYQFVSLPGQSPGRASAIPPASALASTFTLKFFKSLYFPDHLIDLVHIWYDDRYRFKVLFSPLPQGQGHGLRNFFMFKIFKSSYFLNYMIDFVQLVW